MGEGGGEVSIFTIHEKWNKQFRLNENHSPWQNKHIFFVSQKNFFAKSHFVDTMKIMIHKEKSSHITFHGEKELITSHENILYHPPLCCFSPFIQSYVVVLRPCQLLEFYPNRTLLEEHEWSGMGVNKTEPFQLLSKLFSLSISIIFN